MVDTTNLQKVQDYFQANKDQIIKTYDAVGAGIGKDLLDDKQYVIVVYLKDKQLIPKEPVFSDHVALKFEVTGEFNLHSKPG